MCKYQPERLPSNNFSNFNFYMFHSRFICFIYFTVYLTNSFLHTLNYCLINFVLRLSSVFWRAIFNFMICCIHIGIRWGELNVRALENSAIYKMEANFIGVMTSHVLHKIICTNCCLKMVSFIFRQIKLEEIRHESAHPPNKRMMNSPKLDLWIY